MLSRVVFSAAAAAAPCLKNAALLGPGVLQATRIFHTGRPSLAPVPPLPEHGGKVRLGLIPEEFFQFLYPKTGVTGPYVLGTGLILYFLSKEIYVITAETFSAISTIGLLIYVVKKYGASIGEFADKLNEQKIAQLEEVKQASIKQIQDAIDMEKSQQALVHKRHYLFDVQRNNIAMALELTYRERLHRVYKEVKNRLDYHISVQNMIKALSTLVYHVRNMYKPQLNVSESTVGCVAPALLSKKTAKDIVALLPCPPGVNPLTFTKMNDQKRKIGQQRSKQSKQMKNDNAGDMNKLYSIMECILQSIVQLKHKFFLDIETLQSNMLPNFIFECKATKCYSSVYAYAT
ncbi:ATP synthase F(0) complex subunit B1, mitochondrial-like [Leptonychotes weddellii]|uniref:ATP synthase subunit b n=1 Tax=Leptonychotes weddellii TaxID=9713 RepID=A0A2U3XUJ6_LEPWE|nr:ATP synthase F(0) complex subunit B1, mitochondrial-like [Leptonychotes weddellii]